MGAPLKKTILVLVALLALLPASLSQRADCSAVEDDTGGMGIQPAVVQDLAVCASLRNQSQCCTSAYLMERLVETSTALEEGIRAQLTVRRERIEDITNRLEDFVEGQFLERFFNSIDIGLGRNTSNVFGSFLAELRDRFTIRDDEENDQPMERRMTDNIQSFSVRNLFTRLVGRIQDEAVMEFGRTANRSDTMVSDRTLSECVRKVISDAVDNTRMNTVTREIQRLREVVSVHRKIVRFFRDFEEDAGGFRPLSLCALRLTELLFCGRCFARTPPLCHNLCGALAKGCYSPAFGSLRPAFQRVLDISREVLEVAREAVRQLTMSRRLVDLNRETLGMRLKEECNIDTPVSDSVNDTTPVSDRVNNTLRERLGRRQATDGGGDSDEGDSSNDRDMAFPDFPDDIRIDSLTGVFEYSEDGPIVCSSIRTQRRNCWDGEGIRIADFPVFQGDEIDEQGANPAIMLQLELLMAQSALLMNNDPAKALLSDPDFVELVPEGVSLIGAPGEMIEGDGASTLAASAVTLLSLLLTAISVLA